MAGPARNFLIPGAPGALGVITPVSHHFCSECNRIRVTATGLAKGCLFSDSQVDLKPSLLCESSLLLARALGAIVDTKPVRHQMSPEECHHQAFNMSSIGG
jgi:cyclic pyranopterin phosphate synthase